MQGDMRIVVIVLPRFGATWLQNDIDRFFQDRSIVNVVTKRSGPGI